MGYTGTSGMFGHLLEKEEAKNWGNKPGLWWGDRPRNRWVFVIARHCGWAEGMTHASQRTVR